MGVQETIAAGLLRLAGRSVSTVVADAAASAAARVQTKQGSERLQLVVGFSKMGM
jgi:hypothetical protein